MLPFSKLNYIFVGYFNPENILLDNEIINFRGDLTDSAAKKEALAMKVLVTLAFKTRYQFVIRVRDPADRGPAYRDIPVFHTSFHAAAVQCLQPPLGHGSPDNYSTIKTNKCPVVKFSPKIGKTSSAVKSRCKILVGQTKTVRL